MTEDGCDGGADGDVIGLWEAVRSSDVLGDEDGDVVVLDATKEKKLISETNMGSSVYATAVPANGMLFLMNRNQLWALSESK